MPLFSVVSMDDATRTVDSTGVIVGIDDQIKGAKLQTVLQKLVGK